ncbi:MAG: hypothetical protein ACMXX6_01570 [Candidatus Woesearchaeota archaeon]
MKKVIFLLSILLIISACVQSPENNDSYNRYYFYQDIDGFWFTSLRTIYGENEVPFYFHPREVDNLTYNSSINDYLGFVQRNNGRVLIGINEDFPQNYDVVAAVEIGKITGRVLGIETKSGVISAVDDLPVHNCSVADPLNFVIEFRMGNFTGVKSDEFCAIITTTEPRNIIKGANLMAYKLLGIIPLD